ncbi:MAG: TOBE domain-containing protein [Gammaproteobacteria bacterium]
MDEPLSSLDASLRDDMRELIRRLQRQGEHTTLLVTHDQQEAIRLADRVALIFDGRLHMFDRPSAFYERPASRKIAEFFGAENFLEGTVNGGQLHSGFGVLELAHPVEHGDCTVTIRPESVRLGDGDNAIRARVSEASYQGTHIRYTLQANSQSIVAHLPPHVRLTVGEETVVNLPADALWAFERRDG